MGDCPKQMYLHEMVERSGNICFFEIRKANYSGINLMERLEK